VYVYVYVYSICLIHIIQYCCSCIDFQFFFRYYAFDDDLERSGFITHYNSEDSEDDVDWCVRTPDHRLNFQNCNVFHEAPLIESKAKYLKYVLYCSVTLSVDLSKIM
jgi:hypothetical protein